MEELKRSLAATQSDERKPDANLGPPPAHKIRRSKVAPKAKQCIKKPKAIFCVWCEEVIERKDAKHAIQ